MKKSEYGTGKDTAYFKWEKNDKGDYELKETNQNEAQITVHYDESNNQRKEITSTGQSVNQEFVNLVHDKISDNFKGGAVYNNSRSSSNTIISDFISNGLKGSSNGRGGAIYNDLYAQINSIKGDFIGNFALGGHEGYGGAVFNNNTINSIDGDFISNYAKGSTEGYGGAVFNTGTINSIQGDFKNNYIEGNETKGGGIFNDNGASIENIKGNFISNNAQGTESAYGGAVVNTGTINSIEGDFTDNYAQGKKGCGGAIFNDDESFYDVVIKSIEGNFSGNKAIGDEQGLGGAIYNDEGTIEEITGSFYNNTASNKGGAVFNENKAKIGNITGDFIENYAKSSSDVHGGAIYNYKSSSIGDIEGNFIGNYSSAENNTSHGGAIDNCDSTIGKITGDFIENYSQGAQDSFGGAIYNYNTAEDLDSTIGDLTGDFVGNYVKAESGSAIGGAIYNNKATIGNIESDFYFNSAESTSAQGKGGAIANDGTMGYVSGNFVSNSASSLGGALYNTGEIGNKDDNKGIYNSSFYGNEAGEHGGAIYTEKSLKLTADGYVSEFADNKANGENEAIYVGKADDVTLTLSAENGGKFNFFDTINGKEGYNLTITGDDSGEVNLYNNILNADITHKDVTTNVFDAKYLNNSNSLDMESGTININNFGLTQLNFRNFGIQDGTINIDSVDVNLADKVMGKITADSYNESKGGTINVNNLKVLADSSELVTPVDFADAGFADTVQSSVNKAYGPIYQYGVDYLSGAGTKTSSVGSTGDFLFTRIGYNPAILASPVAQLTGGYASMVQTFEYSFEHADTFSALPASVRKAMLNQNKYAITEGSLPLYNNYINKNALWFRPYTSFENIPLKNGPKTSTVLYGSYIGGDSEIFHLKNGWDSVYTGYIGYTGASQSYQGNHTYQNGIVGGVTDTFYKDNFYTALTASVGSSIGETSTMFGNEDFTMLMGGVASKTGYNFEFNDGRFIIQPNLLLSYTFINTFDYTNAANVRINAEPMHAIQVHPYVKFIQNTESGWQPYLAGGFVYNVMGQTQIRVADLYGNNVQLPALSIKPYAEYGVGVQKLWNDKYTGFLQAMARSGGRNGIAFTMGFRIALGDDGKKVEKVKADDNIKTVSNVTEMKKPAKVKNNTSNVKQTANKEHNSFIYNWMLKFSNFFAKPTTLKIKG